MANLLFRIRFSHSYSDCKPNGYIVLCRIFHIEQNQFQIPIENASTRIEIGIWIWICICACNRVPTPPTKKCLYFSRISAIFSFTPGPKTNQFTKSKPKTVWKELKYYLFPQHSLKIHIFSLNAGLIFKKYMHINYHFYTFYVKCT